MDNHTFLAIISMSLVTFSSYKIRYASYWTNFRYNFEKTRSLRRKQDGASIDSTQEVGQSLDEHFPNSWNGRFSEHETNCMNIDLFKTFT